MDESTSKPALVLDSCIWIDLANGNVLDVIIQLPYRIIVPDLLTQEEIRPTNWEDVSRLGIDFIPALPEDLEEISRIYNQSNRSISFPDASALELAKRVSGLLITDDRRLTNTARNYSVQVEGVIWLLNEMVIKKHITGIEAASALDHINQRGHTIQEAELLRWKEVWARE